MNPNAFQNIDKWSKTDDKKGTIIGKDKPNQSVKA